jgi:hypothetical protein
MGYETNIDRINKQGKVENKTVGEPKFLINRNIKGFHAHLCKSCIFNVSSRSRVDQSNEKHYPSSMRLLVMRLMTGHQHQHQQTLLILWF